MRLPDVLRTATFRLTFAHLVAFGLAISFLLGFVYLRTVDQLSRQVEEVIEQDLRAFLATYSAEGMGGLIAVVDRQSRGTGVRLFLLTDGEFQRIAGNLQDWPEDLPPVDGQHRFTIAGPEAEGGDPMPARGTVTTFPEGARLLVAREMSERETFRELIAASSGWALVLALMIGVAEGWLLSRFILRRVELLGQFSAGVGVNDMRARLPLRGTGDEFDRLASEINGLLSRIEHLVRSQRELADNVAHDLRRPLTRLKGRLELLLTGDHDLQGCRRAASESIADADSILSTFEMLLRIAKAEAGVLEEQSARLDLAVLASDMVEFYAPAAAEKNVRIEADLAPAPLDGLRELLAQAIGNLLDNAIKFSPCGRSVQITTSTERDWAILTVADEGPGIPEADRKRVTQRFAQLDGGRSQSGAGLGLALVAATANLHDGHLDFEDNQPGLRAVLRLPSAS